MNSINITGNLGQDPERRSYKDRDGVEQSIAVFSVAVNRPGVRDTTDWFNVKVFGRQADSCLEYLRKGRTVAVQGAMESSKGTGQHEGKTFWEINARQVDFIGSAPEGSRTGGQSDVTPEPAKAGGDLPF